MQAFSVGLRVQDAHRGTHGDVRLVAARALAVVGVLAYNWWVVVPFIHGLMPSVNGFFSDLEVTGMPGSRFMSDADVLSGVAMLAALVLRGPDAADGPRREWKWLLLFAGAGVVGGRFAYACSEGLSATCRRLEWQLALPVHHYVHMAAGIVEFASLTVAAVVAWRRTRGRPEPIARAYRRIVDLLAVGYPLLGVAYLTDRMGMLVEPLFFLSFSAMVLVSVLEPIRPESLPADTAVAAPSPAH